MKTIQLDDIIITNRQRREFNEGELTSLANSISKKGILHAVVLQNDGRTLVAGERRCRAVSMLTELFTSISYDGGSVPEGHIPFVTLDELSEDDLVEAELEENILRSDLTWQEEANAIDKLHQLRVKQSSGAQTLKATAEELLGTANVGAAPQKVRDSIIINEHLADPDVAKAKSPKEAMKIIKKKAEQKLTDSLAANFNITDTPHVFNCGDFRDFVHFIPTSSVDVILTDPPYGIGADSFGDQADAAHTYNDTPEYFEEIIDAFVIEASRVAKEKAHLYAFCDPRNFDSIAEKIRAHGWTVWSTPLIWDKGNGMLPQPDYGPRRNYESIVYAYRGGKHVTAVYGDVLNVAGLQAPKYGAQKPVEVYENLLRRSCKPGDTVWDAFVGAGPIFPAANRVGVRVVGTEMIQEKFNFAKLRLDKEE